jgi:hypothetical protein
MKMTLNFRQTETVSGGFDVLLIKNAWKRLVVFKEFAVGNLITGSRLHVTLKSDVSTPFPSFLAKFQ